MVEPLDLAIGEQTRVRSILVVNPKGGSGKTTVATNLAGGLASRDQQVYLWDLDRQQSSLTWLAMRPRHVPLVNRLDRREGDDRLDLGKGRWLIMDSPAGIHGKNLSHALRIAQGVLVPIQPSVFDMAAAGAFLQALRDEKAVRKNRAFVGILGVRVDPRTKAAATLEAFLGQFELPILTYLRDSQIYPNAAFNGLSIFDLPYYMAERDLEQWSPVLEWVAALN
jgi:chromosome partitioning protein